LDASEAKAKKKTSMSKSASDTMTVRSIFTRLAINQSIN